MLTQKQNEALLSSVCTWEDLDKEIQDEVRERVMSRHIKLFSEVDIEDYPREFIEPARWAWSQIERAQTPWFFMECFFDQIMEGGKLVREYVHDTVQSHCENAIYISESSLDTGLEII